MSLYQDPDLPEGIMRSDQIVTQICDELIASANLLKQQLMDCHGREAGQSMKALLDSISLLHSWFDQLFDEQSNDAIASVLHQMVEDLKDRQQPTDQ